MTRCSCGRVNGRATVYCPGCGKTVNRVLCLAPGCEAQNPLDARFCQTCGSGRLTEGAPAKSLAFVPPLAVLLLVGLGGLTLWATGLPQAAGTTALYAWGRLRQYLYAAGAVAIVGSYVFLFLPDSGRTAVQSLFRMWVDVAKGVLGVLSALVGIFRKAFVPPGKGKQGKDKEGA